MSDNLKQIVKFNEIAGNTCEKRPLDHPLVERYADLMAEEYLELDEAKTVKDTVDALCDLIVVASGMMHVMGYDPNKMLAEVNESNMSKFCFNKEDAIASVDAYEDDNRYVDVHYEKRGDAYVILGHKAGEEGGAYKILKGIHYREPNLEEMV